MRNFLLITLLTLCASVVFAANPWERKAPFKNAVITYEAKGTFKGTRMLYIKDYGKYRAEYTDTAMKILGIKKKKKEFTITTPEWTYTYSDGDDSVIKSISASKCYEQEYKKLSGSDKKKLAKNMEKTGMATLQDIGGELEKGAAKILGYKCDKVTAAGITAYTISGTDITLKSEGSIMGVKDDTEAVKIEKKTPPADKFKVPDGLKIEHTPEADVMACQQIASSMQSIIQGEGKSMIPSAGSSGEGDSMLSEEQKKKLKGVMNMFGGEK